MSYQRSGLPLRPSFAPMVAPAKAPTGPSTAAPTTPPIKAPIEPRCCFACRRFFALNGARPTPFCARTVRVDRAPFERLQLMHAGYRLHVRLLPPRHCGRECSTSHAPRAPNTP